MDKKEILEKQLEIISPDKTEMASLKKEIEQAKKSLEAAIKKKKIDAEVFVGGSFAKGTIIKKEKYDADMFVRFSGKYSEEKIGSLLLKIKPKNALKLHGSRDYFVIKNPGLDIEVIPVIAVKKPQEARNSTDLSYFHVKYVSGKIKKNKKLADEIKIAKAFIHYSGCYGAESYIHGFSGYAVELLIIRYRTFLNFAKAMASMNTEKKLIIDMEKDYRNNDAIMREINESKLESPIILVDPTFKQRNALAALSLDTLKNLKKACADFLKMPSEKFFQKKNKEKELGKYKNLRIIEITTKRQAGDIAGTKLKKFYKFFINEAEKYFIIASDFDYNENENKGVIYISATPKKEIEFKGPPISMKEPLRKFKMQHKTVRIKNGKAFAYRKNSTSLEDFIEEMKNKDIEKMGVENIKLAVSG